MQKSIYTYKNGIKDGLPIGLGYFSVSFAFGVTASSLGIPYFISVLISMTNLTSAGQLAGISVIAAAGTIAEIILTQAIINSRYFLMSLTLTQKLDRSFKTPSRLFFAFAVTDEIFAVAVSKKGNVGKKYFFGLILLPYIGWTLGTLLGALSGNLLSEELIIALGIALYAMFIAIIVPPSINNRGVSCAVLISAAISCCLYFIPFLSGISSGISYVISAVVSAVITAFLFPVKNSEEVSDNELE